MGFETILYEQDKNIGIITLNRPKSLNSVNTKLMEELNLAFDEIAKDDNVSAVILTGGEKVFAAGADIKEVSKLNTPFEAHGFVSTAQRLFNKVERMEKPVIAAVSGLAFGAGCELCLACDIRLAAESALFGQPEIKIGLIPGGGGTQRLPRLIGIGRAKELLYSGDPIDAQEAYRIGLANKVFPVSSLIDETKKMAFKFAQQAGCALKLTKMVVNDGMNMDLQSALSYEERSFEMLFSTEDQKEGVSAFLEKRKPQFKGR